MMREIIVTTSRTFHQLRYWVEAQEQQYRTGAIPMAMYGVPVESYKDVKDCMDRMLEPRTGERLQLVLTEEIAPELYEHPWVKVQLAKLGLWIAGTDKWRLKSD